MRRFFFILIGVPAIVFGQQKEFLINGYLKGLPENAEIVLKNEDISPNPIATTHSKGGKFILKGNISDPSIYNISIPGNSQKLYLFLDNSSIQLTGNKDSLMHAKVSGSATHNDFIQFNRDFNQTYARLNYLTQEVNSGKMQASGQITKEYMQLVSTVEAKTKAFVVARPGSFVSPFVILVSTQFNNDVVKIEETYKMLTPPARSGHFGKILQQVIAEKKIGAVGSNAIEFVQNDTEGKPVALSSFRGKYVLVDFWASWCKPCRMENPNVVEAFEKFKKKNFTVLGVSLDRDREPWIKAIQDDKLAWTQVSDLKFWKNEVATKYRVQSIPQNFLIDPNGKIVAKNLRGGDLHEKLDQILQ